MVQYLATQHTAIVPQLGTAAGPDPHLGVIPHFRAEEAERDY